MKKARDRLIVALDYKTRKEAMELVNLLGDDVLIYKVGLELFLNAGSEIVDALHKKGKKVFLDLKFHDIENTVLQAAEFAISKNVFIFNIHASSGAKTMQAVADLVAEKNSDTIAIAVTVLTNLGDEDIEMMYGEGRSAAEQARHFAGLAKEAGLAGVVCSAQEAADIKGENGGGFFTICPGVRPAFASVGDQKRVMTPAGAIKNGADFLVVGRPIAHAEDKKEACKLILAEMAAALEGGEKIS